MSDPVLTSEQATAAFLARLADQLREAMRYIDTTPGEYRALLKAHSVLTDKADGLSRSTGKAPRTV